MTNTDNTFPGESYISDATGLFDINGTHINLFVKDHYVLCTPEEAEWYSIILRRLLDDLGYYDEAEKRHEEQLREHFLTWLTKE